MTLADDLVRGPRVGRPARPARRPRTVASGSAHLVTGATRLHHAVRSAQPEPSRQGRHGQPVTRSAGRRWTVRSLRYGLPLAVLLVESLLWHPAGAGPVTVNAVQVDQSVSGGTAFCTEQVTALLRRDLDQMARGTGPAPTDQTGSVGEPLMGLVLRQHLTLAHERVLQTAGTDFFALFNRDTDREVRAYAPRVRGACATP